MFYKEKSFSLNLYFFNGSAGGVFFRFPFTHPELGNQKVKVLRGKFRKNSIINLPLNARHNEMNKRKKEVILF